MSSTKFTESPEVHVQRAGWQPPREMAPSTMVAPEPILPRIIGSLGLVALVLGAVTIFLYARFPTQGRIIGPGWARFLAFVGVGAIIYHALVDAEMQVRRLYQLLGYALIVGAVFLTWLPFKEQYGSQFLPWGVAGYVLGMVFLLAFLQHETVPQLRDYAIYTFGILGGAMAVVGFVFSTFGGHAENFLFSHGMLLTLLGLLYGAEFIVQRPTGDRLRQRAAIGMGAIGGLFFLIALYRSLVVHMLASWKWLGPQPSYLMPAGLLLLGLGLIYILTAIALDSELPLVVLTRRELTRFFCTPVAYIVIVVSILLACGMFFVFLHLLKRNFFTMQEPIVARYFLGAYSAIILVLSMMVIGPLLTMGLLSEEQRTGSMEMLLTAPVGETSVVVSKFLAGLAIFMLFWLPWSGYLISLRTFGEQAFDYRPLLSFYIALLFLGADFIAMGLFFSSLTQNQLTAGILSFVGMMFLIVIFFLAQMSDSVTIWTKIVEHTSYIFVLFDAAEGKLTLRRLIFHASAAFFWLVLTVKALEVRRWR